MPRGVLRIGAATGSMAATASDVAVAVIDTGVDTTHPDLNVDLPGYNAIAQSESVSVADGSGHGTHVAGVVAAKNNAGIGVVGVAPGTRIIPVKVRIRVWQLLLALKDTCCRIEATCSVLCTAQTISNSKT